MFQDKPTDEQCKAAEMEDVELEFEGHIRYDVVAEAEAVCQEPSVETQAISSWQAAVKKAVAISLIFAPGMW